jgi:hypothetical protein
VNVYGKKHEGA